MRCGEKVGLSLTFSATQYNNIWQGVTLANEMHANVHSWWITFENKRCLSALYLEFATTKN